MPRILLLIFLSVSSLGLSKEVTLTIQTQKSKIIIKRSDLLTRKQDLETVFIPIDPTYSKPMTYTAIRVTKLFDSLKLPPEHLLQFKALDGFSAPISLDRLLNTDKQRSIAYIAIEPSDKFWPPIKAGSKLSAGPFYLIWQNPEASQISREEWPYQLVSFEVLGPLLQTYPDIFPDEKLAADSSIRKGFAVFRTNCFTCHTMNKNGASQLGPDLNFPMSPVEYFNEEIFKKYIRNPQAVRHWPQAKMTGFSKEAISDQQLSDLLDYFKHMKSRKLGF